MNDTTWTCDRCNEINDISDVRIVEHADGIGEVVCKACAKDEHENEMNKVLFSSYADEI